MKLARASERGPFKVIVPIGGSDYVGDGESRKAILRILWVYGYLSGSSLGYRGALKLVHGKYGDVVPTAKVYLLLNEASKENPLVELIWEAARGLWRLYGDGVKTALLLAYKLYERALSLERDYGLRPSTILEGYSAAYKVYVETLEELAGRSPRLDCATATRALLTGSQASGILGPLLCRALERYKASGCGKPFSEVVDFERIEGGSLSDSTLVEGVVVRKRLSRPGMPRLKVGPLRVAVVDQKLYVDLRYEGYNFVVSDPEAALRLGEELSRSHLWAVEKLSQLGVGLLVDVKGLEAGLEEELERRGVLVLRRIPPEKARLIATASGARLLSRLQDAGPGDVGVVDHLEERVFGDRYYTILEARGGCVSTIVIRGPWYAVDTAYEEARMAARGLEAYAADPRSLPGGGAPEVEAALRIREQALRAGGKKRLAMEAFAEAIEVIPSTLARHSALKPHEALAALEALHAQGRWAAGVNEYEKRVDEDLAARGILDPYPIRRAAAEVGVSLAMTLLRVTGISVHRRGAHLREIREPHR